MTDGRRFLAPARVRVRDNRDMAFTRGRLVIVCAIPLRRATVRGRPTTRDARRRRMIAPDAQSSVEFQSHRIEDEAAPAPAPPPLSLPFPRPSASPFRFSFPSFVDPPPLRCELTTERVVVCIVSEANGNILITPMKINDPFLSLAMDVRQGI